MKRTFYLVLIITLFLITGCSVRPISNDLATNVNKILNSPSNLYNQTSLGYKYYLPMGFLLIGDNKNNQIIYHNGNRIYMYVDVIGYYFRYQADVDMDSKADSYFAKLLDHDGIKGYIEVTRYENQYFIDIVYNFARIEAYVARHEINTTVLNGLRILSSVNFNDSVIKDIMASNQGVSREEVFNLYQPRERTGNFLEYLEAYDRYIDDELQNQGEVRINQRHE